MKRQLYSRLLEWKASIHRKPLILRGARQVGKTTLLKKFGKNEYSACLYLNFEENPKLDGFFQQKLDPVTILQNIALYFNTSIEPKQTLIIFDEIQESQAALNSLKYFQEQAKEYHVVGAGSLLGVKLGHTHGFPVGKVTFMDLYPLGFLEFLSATKKEELAKYLSNIHRNNPDNKTPPPIHEELLELLKRYMVVGGMPEAVQAYIDSENFMDVRKIQNDILDAYSLDFAKHAPKESVMKISEMWQSIPVQLAKENKKFKWSDVKTNARAREYEATLEWLIDAGLVLRSFSVSSPKFPLSAYKAHNIFKLFLLDVGLLAAMSRLSPKIILEGNSMYSEFKGAFTENFIAQTLIAQEHPLYYWASEGRAEIDFLIECDNNIYPLEVKSGTSSKKQSLKVYDEKFNPEVLLRTSLMNLKKDGKILNVPLYLASQLMELLSASALIDE